MPAIKRIIGWLGGKALLYVALVLAILAGTFVAPWVERQWRSPARQLSIAEQIETGAVRPLTEARETTQRRLIEAGAQAGRKGLAEIDQAILTAAKAKAEAVRARRGVGEKAASLATGDTSALLADGRRELEIQFRDAEIATLTAARDRIERRGAAERARASCRAARLKLEASQARWEVRATLGLYDQAERRDLTARMKDLCDRSRAADRRQIAAERGGSLAQIQPVTGELEAQIARIRNAASGSWGQKLSLWSDQVQLPQVLRNAGLALAAIIAAPYLIRLFCYFVLAPAAMGRPAIRIAATGAAAVPIPPTARSTTAVDVRLEPGEQLLVKHGYLQTTSEGGAKETQWLLDGRHPISSLATGLTFLTRIRGDGEVTGVSAVRDPFAEVAVMTLPAGAACVLQPRALAAVAEPMDRRLRISAHWRLFSLNAWLTLQLRYLVFHGPARLVLKGARGVRVEPAQRGRIFGQDQVVGFSTDLAYSVTRNETFWPYFIGREPLLKDRVAAGEGVLIIEEAPMAGRHGGQVRRGIEGMIDAGMKVFGL